MCGIIGQISFTNAFDHHPKLDLLKHRGPDGRGEWANQKKNIYFGHTRLAILEPTLAGQQPMTDASERYVITFNGEIYNHEKLRKLLSFSNWRGNSDTETLVEILAVMGIGALDHLKGMFAFALYDSADDSVLLVRDRLGIKPLWVKHNERYIQFSSEISTLLVPGKASVTGQALSEYIAFGRMPEYGEVVEGIESVPPGSWLKIKTNGEVTKGKWWPRSSYTPLKPKSHKESSQQVKHLLTTAVEEHLISDVGIGSFLSGGIDSSIVTLLAGKILGKSLKTFTIGFPQKAFDERSIARKVAQIAGAEHTEIEVNQDTCLDLVKEAVMRLDLPSIDAINTYIVSKTVRGTGLKVALSGLGADELFGGYPSFNQVPRLHLLLNILSSGVRKRFIKIMPHFIEEKLGGITDVSVSSLVIARRRHTSIRKLTSIGLNSGCPKIPSAPTGLDMMGVISWSEIHGYMIPMLLRDSDQMSMAVGLEIRVPFLDHLLVEEVLRLSQEQKQAKGLKPLLVEAFRSELPQEVYNRPKQGFVLPMDQWIRGPLNEFTKEGVTASANLMSLAEPIKQLESFNKGSMHWTRIWSWCVLGHWLANRTNNNNEV